MTCGGPFVDAAAGAAAGRRRRPLRRRRGLLRAQRRLAGRGGGGAIDRSAAFRRALRERLPPRWSRWTLSSWS